MKCKNCGNELSQGDLFCIKCGTKVDTAINQERVVNIPIKKKKNGFVFGIIAGMIVVIALLTLVFNFIYNSNKTDNSQMFYVEDNELMMVDLGKSDFETVQLNDEYKDSEIGWSDYGFIYDNIEKSSNGKIYYYPTEINDEFEYDLCAAIIKKGEAMVHKIDSSVSYFQILDDDSILYNKQGKLYHYKDEEKTKIASGILSYYISEDQKSVLWTENEEYDEDTYEYKTDIYYNTLTGNDEEVCIEKNVIYIGNTMNLDIIFVKKHGDLYKYDLEGESEKLLSDCNYVYPVDLEAEKFYYTIENVSEVSLTDYLDDPYFESDQNQIEPFAEDFEEEIYDEYWDYTYIETDWDAYYEALDAYDAVNNRNLIREDLKQFESDFFINDLYYFDGEESALVTENFEYFLDTPEENQYVCSVKEYKDNLKISIDDIWDAYDLYYEIEESENAEWKTLIYSNGESELLEAEDIYYVWIDENILFYWLYNETEIDEDKVYDQDEYYNLGVNTFTLYSFDLSKNNFGDVKEISDKMNVFEGTMDGNPYYICDEDAETGEGDLYCGMDEITSDVSADSVGFFPEENAVIFTRDMDQDEYTSSIVTYKDGNELEIADDVNYFSAKSSDCIVFISEFDWYDMCGELMIYDKGETKNIASDVSMFSGFNNGVQGAYYGSW